MVSGLLIWNFIGGSPPALFQENHSLIDTTQTSDRADHHNSLPGILDDQVSLIRWRMWLLDIILVQRYDITISRQVTINNNIEQEMQVAVDFLIVCWFLPRLCHCHGDTILSMWTGHNDCGKSFSTFDKHNIFYYTTYTHSKIFI